MLDAGGVHAPHRPQTLAPPTVAAGGVGIVVAASIGDYRAGDELWCEVLAADAFAQALNRDVLVPRPGGRFAFGRLIGRDGEKLHLLPPGPGTRQQVIPAPPWLARTARLIRAL